MGLQIRGLNVEVCTGQFFRPGPGPVRTHFFFAGPARPIEKISFHLPARPVEKIMAHLPARYEPVQTSNSYTLQQLMESNYKKHASV